MERHARETYPEECCGFLIGRIGEPARVVEARRAKNVATANRPSRYIIDSLELLHADDEVRARGHDVVGIYHSHPDHPAAPSEFDRSRASPWYSYVIVSVVDGEPRETTAWKFNESTKRFDREEVVRKGNRTTRNNSARRRN